MMEIIEPDLCNLEICEYFKERGPWCFTYSNLYCKKIFKTSDKFNRTLVFNPGDLVSAMDIDYHYHKDSFVPALSIPSVLKWLRESDIVLLPRYIERKWSFSIYEHGDLLHESPEQYDTYQECMNSGILKFIEYEE